MSASSFDCVYALYSTSSGRGQEFCAGLGWTGRRVSSPWTGKAPPSSSMHRRAASVLYASREMPQSVDTTLLSSLRTKRSHCSIRLRRFGGGRCHKQYVHDANSGLLHTDWLRTGHDDQSSKRCPLGQAVGSRYWSTSDTVVPLYLRTVPL